MVDLRPGQVSIVIPTYNHEDLVLETLASVFAQTFTDYEVIVVNDGSPDDTAEVLRPLAEAGRIRYIEQPNQGQGAARNRGLAEARGEFVAFLDDDDLWPPDKLEWQHEVMRSDPGTVLVYGHEGWLQDGVLGLPKPEDYPSGDANPAFRRRNWITSPGQTLIRTAALREIGGFDPGIWGADDWDLYIRLSKRGRFRYISRVALHYRVHGGNASRRAIQHAQNHHKVARRHIGWNLPLLVSNRRSAAAYFVPNLLQLAEQCRKERDLQGMLSAYLYALSFRPGMLFRRRELASGLRKLTRLVVQGLRRGVTQ